MTRVQARSSIDAQYDAEEQSISGATVHAVLEFRSRYPDEPHTVRATKEDGYWQVIVRGAEDTEDN